MYQKKKIILAQFFIFSHQIIKLILILKNMQY